MLRTHPRLRQRFAGAKEIAGSFRGWRLPCGSERRRLAGDGWMLVGDAASLVDPFSGEGISNAMHGAMLKADPSIQPILNKIPAPNHGGI